MAAEQRRQRAKVDARLQHLPHHHGQQQAAEVDDQLARQAAEHRCLQQGRIRRFRVAEQVLAAPQELHQAQGHHDAGQREAIPPADLLADPGHDQRREERADVDAHVEDGEARVASRVVDGIQAPHDGGDVGLEEAHAHADQCQREVHHLHRERILGASTLGATRRMARVGHAQLTQHQQRAAEHHGLAHAQVLVGQQAAQQRQGVGQAGVGAQQQVAVGVAEEMVLGQVQEQQRLHAVEGKALPHLGQEADVQALGVAHELARGGQGCGGSGSHKGLRAKQSGEYSGRL